MDRAPEEEVPLGNVGAAGFGWIDGKESKSGDAHVVSGFHTADEPLNTKADDDQPNADGNDDEQSIRMEDEKPVRLIYKVTDNPPPHIALLFAVQMSLLAISSSLTVSLMVSELICARRDDEIKAQIMSATFFMVGISTFTMTTLGVRLPIFQGPGMAYIVPLFALQSMPEWQCPTQEELALSLGNMTSSFNGTVSGEEYIIPREWITDKIRQLSGSLMAAGCFHTLIGLTGLVGFIMRFVGPITIVSAIVLVGLSFFKVAVRFVETQWGVTALTFTTAVTMALYLSKRSSPVPFWNRRRGLHIKWTRFHQMFAILIAIITGWLTSALLTHLDVLSDDPDSNEFYARTDTRNEVINKAYWFSVPYPGQFGAPSFHVGAFITFFVATLLSVLDSLGDYSACARTCYVPQPPDYAFNRGMAVEGIMSILSGSMGAGHSTVSCGDCVGAIGLTKVASRTVFQVIGLLFVLFAVVNKVGAFLVTIPYCVLGGCQVLTVGIFIGVVLSNLQYVDLNSTRNLAIIGVSLLLGLMLPYYVEKDPEGIETGNVDLDRVIGVLMGNAVFVGGFFSCFLDNTVPGTRVERGLARKASSKKKSEAKDKDEKEGEDNEYENGPEIYDIPWIPKRVKESSIARFIRIFPGRSPTSTMTEGVIMTM